MSTNTQTFSNSARIIARASLSILAEKPRYSRQDKHDLDVLREYGF